MPDKGRIMSQTFYERQSKLMGLFKEAFVRNEMNVNEAVKALRTLGFGKIMAANRVREWAALPDTNEAETERAVKLRHKQQASLEMYMLRMEYMRLRKKNKKDYMSKSDILNELFQSGYRQEYVKCVVSGWDKEKLKNIK